MSQTASNVAAASPVAAGGMWVAPLGTPLPTSATAALNAAFIPLGYVSTDGVQDSSDAASREDVFAWGGDQVATLLQQGSVKRYTVKLIEVYNPDVAEFIYGEDNVAVTAAAGGDGTKIAIGDTGEEIAPCVVVFDMKYGEKRERRVVPKGQPQVTAEDPLVHTALAGYEVQTTCLKDDSGKRQYIYRQNDDVEDES